jgi:hypothetical protein
MAGETRTIDQIIRTLTTFIGNERLPGRDGGGDFKFELNSLKTWLQSFFPAGTPTRIIPGTLVLSWVDATTLGTSVGSVMDDTFSYALSLTGAFTKTLGAWAVGTGNGGKMSAAAMAASTTYHVYLIRKDSNGSIDCGFDVSAIAPTMPAGYTYKRRIGCFRTDGAAEIVNFYQIGNMFRFMAQKDDRPNAAIANTNRNLLTVSAPENCIGIFDVRWFYSAASAHHYGIVQSVSETDNAPSTTNQTIHLYLQNSSCSQEQQISINSNGQIAYRGDTTDFLLRIGCLGWIDPLL